MQTPGSWPMAGWADETVDVATVQRPEGHWFIPCDRAAAVTVLTVGGDVVVGTATVQTTTGDCGVP